jgi:glycosyltransferase involved in cell wall biosynthesis
MGNRACIIVLNPFVNDSRVRKTAETIRRSGCRVRVVALEAPGLPYAEVVDGIEVLRPRLRSRRLPRNALTRIISFLEFAVRAAGSVRGSTIVWCNDLGTIVMARIWRAFLLGKRRWVYDSHEMAINDFPGESRGRIVAKYWLEKLSIGAADRVICVSPEIARAYAFLYGIRRPSIVLNCPPQADVLPSSRLRDRLGLRSDQRIFLYQGRLTKGRGIAALIDAFALRDGDADVVVFMGYGPMEETLRNRASGCPRIRLHPAVPPGDLLAWTASADYGLCFTEDTCLTNRWCLPNKLFEYMAAGIPVVASNTPSVARLVRSERFGVIAGGSGPAGINDAIDRVLAMDRDHLRRAARDASRRYNWEAQQSAVLESAGIYAASIGPSAPSRE